MGESWTDPEYSRLPPSVAAARREREIVALTVAGQTAPAIAAALFLSERTVESHLARAYAKCLGRITRSRGIPGAARCAGGRCAAARLSTRRTVRGGRVLWVPMLDGTERAGVLRGRTRRRRCPTTRCCVETCGRCLGCWVAIIVAKVPYSDRLRRVRNAGGLSRASELMWQLLPPRAMATERVVIRALLEPHDRVGNAYDYSVDIDVAMLAVYVGLGHDLPATQTTAPALTAIRNARRAGVVDLAVLACADGLLMQQRSPLRIVTAVLARLDTRTGAFSFLLAGHPPPRLLRNGRLLQELAHPPVRRWASAVAVRESSSMNSSNRGTGCCCIPMASPRPATTPVILRRTRLIEFTEQAELDGHTMVRGRRAHPRRGRTPSCRRPGPRISAAPWHDAQ